MKASSGLSCNAGQGWFRGLRFTALLAVLTGSVGWAQMAAMPQEEAAAGPKFESAARGWHVESASIFSSYYSSLLLAGPNSDPDLATGGTVTVSWSRLRESSSLLLTYTPTYNRDLTYSELNALNHDFSFAATKHFRPNWSFNWGATAQVMNTGEFLFQPNQFSRVIGLAADADQLAGVFLTNASFSNASLASLLAGAPALENPARRQYFGDRMLNAAFQATLGYRKRRLSVSLLGGGGHNQSLSTGSLARLQSPALIPDTNAGRAGINVAYSLSPRTEVGISALAERTVSRYQDVYTSMVSGTFGRRISRRWFTELHGGIGGFKPLRNSFQLAGGPQYVAGGGLGFKTYSHALLFSADRTILDSFGVGANSNLNTTASWNWARPGTGWKIMASESWQEISSGLFGQTRSWLFSSGFSRQLSPTAALTGTYTYMHSANPIEVLVATPAIQGVRLALVWTRQTAAPERK